MTSRERSLLWAAIHRYVELCNMESVGGDLAKVRAVDEVEALVKQIANAAVKRTLDEALNSGDGSYKP